MRKFVPTLLLVAAVLAPAHAQTRAERIIGFVEFHGCDTSKTSRTDCHANGLFAAGEGYGDLSCLLLRGGGADGPCTIDDGAAPVVAGVATQGQFVTGSAGHFGVVVNSVGCDSVTVSLDLGASNSLYLTTALGERLPLVDLVVEASNYRHANTMDYWNLTPGDDAGTTGSRMVFSNGATVIVVPFAGLAENTSACSSGIDSSGMLIRDERTQAG